MKAKKRRAPAAVAAQGGGGNITGGKTAGATRTAGATYICGALIVGGLLVYAQTFHFGFVAYDDDVYVYLNPMLKAGLSGAGMAWAMTAFASANWHPFTWISYLLDAQVFGIHAGAFHAVNVILHLASAVLLFLALLRMTGLPLRCAAVAGVFLLHPLHVESVAWVSERKDVLSTCCEMLALLLYARYAERRTLLRYVALAVAFALGLMAKPMLVTFPFVLLLLDLWPLQRMGWPPKWEAVRPLVWEKVPLLAMSAAGCMLTFAAQRSAGAVAGLTMFSTGARVANAIAVYVEYIGQSIWPVNLAVLYPASAPAAGEVVLASVVLLAITAAVLRVVRERPYLLVGWLWYLGMLVPVIGLVQVGSQSRADRYMYVPMVGLSLAVIWGVSDWAERRPNLRVPLTAGTGALLLLYGGLAFHQTGYWQDSHTLFEHTLAVTKDNLIIQNNLGMTLAVEGKQEAAAAHYRQALAINSHYAMAHYNLGLALAALGQFDEAAGQYRQALAITPNDAQAHGNLGHELLRSGQYAAAVEELNTALRLKSTIPVAHADLGILLGAQGDYAGAASHLLAAAQLVPEAASNESNLSFVLLRAGRTDEAIVHARNAVRLDPEMAVGHMNLAAGLAAAGRKDEARAEYGVTLRLNPGSVEARQGLDGLK